MSYELEIDVYGAEELATAFELAPEDLRTSLLPEVDESGAELQRDWRALARRSAGTHGKYYPASITHDLNETHGAIWTDVGPDANKLQGGMGPGFEYGSRNTPPHPDGAAAFAANGQKFYNKISKAVDDIIRKSLL